MTRVQDDRGYEKDDEDGEEEEEEEYALEDNIGSSTNRWLLRFRRDSRSQQNGLVFYKHFWSQVIIPTENRFFLCLSCLVYN